MAGEDAFNSACQAVLARMIDTVPSNVQLTDEIALLPEKVWGALITVERGIMVFKTNFRVCLRPHSSCYSLKSHSAVFSSPKLLIPPSVALVSSHSTGATATVPTPAARPPIPPPLQPRSSTRKTSPPLARQ